MYGLLTWEMLIMMLVMVVCFYRWEHCFSQVSVIVVQP